MAQYGINRYVGENCTWISEFFLDIADPGADNDDLRGENVDEMAGAMDGLLSCAVRETARAI
jgi:hypothetical protein